MSTSELNTDEFDDEASAVGTQATDLSGLDRVAAASRGSGNPAALAWLAENLRLDAQSSVADLGAGLGGPAAWLRERYRVMVTCMEPAEGASQSLKELFAIPVAVASADRLPIRGDAFDVGLLLGVLSVVERPEAVLAEARRVSRSLGVLEYCSTGDATIVAGGSSFTTADALLQMIDDSGWTIVQHSPVGIATPTTWSAAADRITVAPTASEQEVIGAVGSGTIAPFVVVARR
jgi:SAM-dependent methyltransferase